MGLSESEKRVLEELERGLYAEDAAFERKSKAQIERIDAPGANSPAKVIAGSGRGRNLNSGIWCRNPGSSFWRGGFPGHVGRNSHCQRYRWLDSQICKGPEGAKSR